MYVTDYFWAWRGYYRSRPRKVEPVDPSGDPAYENPKGKRDFYRKAKNSKKISGKNLVNIWV